MPLSCRDAVDPSAEAAERRGGPVDVPDPVQQATSAPQRPGVGQLPDRPRHQGAQARPGGGCGRVRPACAGRWWVGPRSARASARALAILGIPGRPGRVTPVASRAARTPETSSDSCSWQLPGQPPSHHSRSPWMVDSATPWAVWMRRLASYRTFWLAHPPGRCPRVAHRLTDLGPADPDHPGAASVGQPSSGSGGGCRPGQVGGLGTGARGARQASAAPRWAETSMGGRTTETGPPGRREHPPMEGVAKLECPGSAT